MATPAQAAAATVGAGSLAAAGAYGITQAVNGSGEEQTTEESTSDSEVPTPSTFASSDLTSYTNKTLSFLKIDHLTKLVKAIDENNDWWKLAFNNRYSNREGLTVETTFNNLSDYAALKNACKTAYEKEKAYFNTDNFLENIGAFCTTEKLSTLEPKVVSYATDDDFSSYPNGLLSVNENKTKLIKTKVGSGNKVNDNDLWWEWAFKNIFKKTESKSTDFSGVNHGYSSSNDTGTDKYLNNACDAAYKKPYSNLKSTIAAPNLITDIKKFCSVAGEQTVLVLPEPTSPTKITNASDYKVDKSLAKKTENQSKLIDPKNNQDWWTWSFDTNFPKEGNEKKNKLPTLFSSVNTAYTTFTEPNQIGETPTSLNQACRKAYDKTKSQLESTEEGKDKIYDWVKNLCTTKTLSEQLTLPED